MSPGGEVAVAATHQRHEQATLEEVAALAGVSRATVSRVINGRSRVSQQTRVAVERAVARLGYVPNRAARSLVTRRADMIGLATPENTDWLFDDPFFPRLLHGITGALPPELELVVFMPKPTRDETRLASYLTAGHVDGVLVVSQHGPGVLPRELERLGIPVVLCGRPLGHSALSWVDADNQRGGALAVGHLVERGRQVIATVTGPQDMAVGVDRLAGWRQALEAAGRSPDPDLIEVGDFTYQRGVTATEALLRRRPDIDGLFASSELTALGALKTLRAAGRRVPDDVAVVGFDDTALALSADPPLTVVRQPIELMGQEMIRLLLQTMATGDRTPRHVVLGTELVVRASSGPEPGSG
jgi:DNA-binding LacI/PurR family transcriptional regulator